MAKESWELWHDAIQSEYELEEATESVNCYGGANVRVYADCLADSVCFGYRSINPRFYPRVVSRSSLWYARRAS